MISQRMMDVLEEHGHLGFITKDKRSEAQNVAHEQAMKSFTYLNPKMLTQTSGDVKVMLTDFWKAPDVVEDISRPFTGFHQLTGSCVGASSGNAIFTLSAVQRMIASGPTKAFIPFWPFAYGRTRFNEGDSGQGEGAVDSVMGQTLCKEGVFGIAEASNLPTFDTSDGYTLTQQIEMQWSDGAASVVQACETVARTHLVGAAAVLNSPSDIKAAITNGYPVLDGCNNFCQSGSTAGAGYNTYVRGHYDGRGGHSTCFLGYWDHPNDGPLFLYSNQWPASTYPQDPAGGGRCCVWLPESEVDKLFQTGGSGGETMALSHLTYFPAQPKVLDWATW